MITKFNKFLKNLPKKMSETPCSNHEHAFPSLFPLNALTIKMQKKSTITMGLGFTLHEFRRRKPTALSLKVSISFFCERYPTPTPLLHPDQQNAISAKKNKNPPGFTFKALHKTV
jgi:hypothetical protein